jgi:hypothetical protein
LWQKSRPSGSRKTLADTTQRHDTLKNTKINNLLIFKLRINAVGKTSTFVGTASALARCNQFFKKLNYEKNICHFCFDIFH